MDVESAHLSLTNENDTAEGGGGSQTENGREEYQKRQASIRTACIYAGLNLHTHEATVPLSQTGCQPGC